MGKKAQNIFLHIKRPECQTAMSKEKALEDPARNNCYPAAPAGVAWQHPRPPDRDTCRHRAPSD